MTGSVLDIRGLTKKFGPATVLSGVDLRIEPGEIHGLVGANGSGKTTLLRIVAGHPSIALSGGCSGRMTLAGQPYAPFSPREARACGVGFVHQESVLIPGLSLEANVTLGRERVHATRWPLPSGLGLVDRQANARATSLALSRLGVRLPPATPARDLPLAVRTLAEAARELSRDDLRLVLLDEPASALDADSRTLFHAALAELAGRGVGVLYVSHRLEDLFAVCSAVTVLRDGCVAARLGRDAFAADNVLRFMAHGGEGVREHGRPVPDATLFAVRGLRVDLPGERVHELDLDVGAGEVLGLAGLSGHGKLAVAPGVLGLARAEGQLCWSGTWAGIRETGARLRSESAYIPEDRRHHGLLPERSVAENIVFSAAHKGREFAAAWPLGRCGFLDRRRVRAHAEDMVRRLGIVCAGIDQPVGQLSGGNQQKVCLARALTDRPRLLFVSEPTRGIDLAAKETVLNLLGWANAERGMSLIIASSELDELRRLCHRLAVIREGRCVAVVPGATDELALTRLMFEGRA
jgi:simple sugar transport system ATP-binding protein